MRQGLIGLDSDLRSKLQHSIEQIQSQLIHLWQNHAQVLRGVDMEIALIFRELGDTGPRALRGCTHESEDLLQLVLISGSRKEGTAGIHFCHYAACRPNVDAGAIGTGSKKHVWSAIPEGYDLIGECIHWNAKGASESEVGKFELSLVVDEQVLRLQIPVQNPILVTELDSLQDLVHEGFDSNIVQLASTSSGIHVFLQVFIHIFKYQHEFVFGVDDIIEGDNIFMFEFFH